MERQLQERLIGATVLMIVAVLVVPELLSGPKPAVSASPVGAGGDSLILGESLPTIPTEVPRVATALGRAAPASVSPPAPLPSSPPSAAPAPLALPEPATPAAAPPRTTRPAPRAPVASPIETSARPAAAPAAPLAKPGPPQPGPVGKGSWSVQVGSYAKPATAKRIAKELQNHGFPAVVLPVDLQGKRLYRVRVGPPTDRKTADQTLRKVQHLMPSSRLVGNP